MSKYSATFRMRAESKANDEASENEAGRRQDVSKSEALEGDGVTDGGDKGVGKVGKVVGNRGSKGGGGNKGSKGGGKGVGKVGKVVDVLAALESAARMSK